VIDERLKLNLGTKVLSTNFTGFELEPSGRLIWTLTPSYAYGQHTRTRCAPLGCGRELLSVRFTSATRRPAFHTLPASTRTAASRPNSMVTKSATRQLLGSVSASIWRPSTTTITIWWTRDNRLTLSREFTSTHAFSVGGAVWKRTSRFHQKASKSQPNGSQAAPGR
jgi:hypothetical protein